MIKAHKTAVFKDDYNFTKVIYHSTKVVSFNSDTIVLNSGGYETKTTKDLINQTAIEYCLDYMIYQKDYYWFVKVGSKVYPFEDKMILKSEKHNSLSCYGGECNKWEVFSNNAKPIKADKKETKRHLHYIINNKLI